MISFSMQPHSHNFRLDRWISSFHITRVECSNFTVGCDVACNRNQPPSSYHICEKCAIVVPQATIYCHWTGATLVWGEIEQRRFTNIVINTCICKIQCTVDISQCGASKTPKIVDDENGNANGTNVWNDNEVYERFWFLNSGPKISC